MTFHLSYLEELVCKIFHVRLNEIRSNRVSPLVSWPRMVMFYLARHYTTKSYPEIGRYFNRDHTTIIHGVRKITFLLKWGTEPTYFERNQTTDYYKNNVENLITNVSTIEDILNARIREKNFVMDKQRNTSFQLRRIWKNSKQPTENNEIARLSFHYRITDGHGTTPR